MLLEVDESEIIELRDLYDPTVRFIECAAQRGGFITYVVTFFKTNVVGIQEVIEVNYIPSLDTLERKFLPDIHDYEHSIQVQLPPHLNGSRFIQFFNVENISKFVSVESEEVECMIEGNDGRQFFTGLSRECPVDHTVIYAA